MRLTCLLMLIFSFFAKPVIAQKSIYEFKIPALSGELIDFNRYKGKWLLIVNTASKCGYTPQYKDLELLHRQHGNKVAVLGFPANNFLWQEPGNNLQIAEFCEKNYGVSFQMFEKISVKGGSKHPLYQWLEIQSGKTPGWNFSKYLINPEGKVTGFYASSVNPLDKQILGQILK